jgi:RNA polymerase sigma-70 factor (ECF subfamily)
MAAPDPRLDAIARAHGGFVKSLALKLAPFPGAADDIAQQVFLEFLRKAESWDLVSDVRPLLATMTRYVAARLWRERTQAMSPAMRELAGHIARLSDAQDVAWYSDEEKAALRRCLDRLPEKSRHLARIHYFLGVPSVDIARQMRLEADAVRRALFRIRGQLRRCVEDAVGGTVHG